VILKEGVNKSNHTIQTPFLLVTEPSKPDILVSEVGLERNRSSERKQPSNLKEGETSRAETLEKKKR
jgi:hypothetical protein